jgi:hypothetical protein
MRAEEFDSATVKQLQAKANQCFEEAEAPVDPFGRPSEAQRNRLLMQAQFYLTAVSRKRDEEVANRDLTLEIVVIVLISIEIVLSIGFGWSGVIEAREQAKIFAHMEKSTSDTASAMNDAKKALETLEDEQKRSLTSLGDMNQALQASTSTTRKQLGILQQEQSERLTQQSKKPKLELYFGTVLVDTVQPVNLAPRNQTETQVSYDFMLKNSGNATANKGLVRVIVSSKDVEMSSNGSWRVDSIPISPGDTTKVFLLHFDYLRPIATIPLSVTFTFPNTQLPFQVLFNVDADEIATATFLGAMTVPLRPTK